MELLNTSCKYETFKNCKGIFNPVIRKYWFTLSKLSWNEHPIAVRLPRTIEEFYMKFYLYRSYVRIRIY